MNPRSAKTIFLPTEVFIALLWSSPTELSLWRCRVTLIKIFQLPNTMFMPILFNFPLPLPNLQKISTTAASMATVLTSYVSTWKNNVKINFYFLLKTIGRGRQNWKRESSAQLQYSKCLWEYFLPLFFHLYFIKQHRIYVYVALLLHSPVCSLSVAILTLRGPTLLGSLS